MRNVRWSTWKARSSRISIAAASPPAASPCMGSRAVCARATSRGMPHMPKKRSEGEKLMRHFRTAMLGAGLTLAATAANAQSVVEQASEHRFQLDFHVNDAALQKMLPAGWEPAIAT